MIVEKTLSIGGVNVKLHSQVAGFNIYEPCGEDVDEQTLYFVKGQEVLFIQEITADCGQNQGYVKSVEFKAVQK